MALAALKAASMEIATSQRNGAIEQVGQRTHAGQHAGHVQQQLQVVHKADFLRGCWFDGWAGGGGGCPLRYDGSFRGAFGVAFWAVSLLQSFARA